MMFVPDFAHPIFSRMREAYCSARDFYEGGDAAKDSVIAVLRESKLTIDACIVEMEQSDSVEKDNYVPLMRVYAGNIQDWQKNISE
jgi:hypothetical protein